MLISLYPVPEDPDKPVLPTGQFEGEVWSQWINSVRRRSEARPGLETLVVCAFITAMHDPSCKLLHDSPIRALETSKFRPKDVV